MQWNERIHSARKGAGLTLDQLAARLGTTRATLIQWEHGRGPGPRMLQVPAIAEALGVSINWLVIGREKRRA